MEGTEGKGLSIAMFVLTAMTPRVRSATPLAFKSRAERSRDCEESLRAEVAFGVDADQTVDVFILILPGRVEGEEKREFVDMF